MRHMTLTNDQVDLLKSGILTRLPVLAHTGDVFHATGADRGHIITAAGTVRLAIDDVIQIDTPLQKNVLQARFTGLAGTHTVCRYVFDISDTELRFLGYGRVTDLWMDWVEQYDGPAAWWWRACETLIDLPLRTRVFRRFLKTRPQDRYLSWVLMLTPMVEVAHDGH